MRYFLAAITVTVGLMLMGGFQTAMGMTSLMMGMDNLQGTILGWSLFLWIVGAGKVGQARREWRAVLALERDHAALGTSAFEVVSDTGRWHVMAVAHRVGDIGLLDDPDQLFAVPEEQICILQRTGPLASLSARCFASQLCPWVVILVPRTGVRWKSDFLLLHELTHSSRIGWMAGQWTLGLFVPMLALIGLVAIGYGAPNHTVFLGVIGIATAVMALVMLRVAQPLEEAMCDTMGFLEAPATSQRDIKDMLLRVRVINPLARAMQTVRIEYSSRSEAMEEQWKWNCAAISGRFTFRVFRCLTWWLAPRGHDGPMSRAKVLWGLAKIVSPLSLAVLVGVSLILVPIQYPWWVVVMVGLLAARSILASRSLSAELTMEVARRLGPLLRLDPHCSRLLSEMQLASDAPQDHE